MGDNGMSVGTGLKGPSDPDAIRRLILAGGEVGRFHDPTRPYLCFGPRAGDHGNLRWSVHFGIPRYPRLAHSSLLNMRFLSRPVRTSERQRRGNWTIVFYCQRKCKIETVPSLSFDRERPFIDFFSD